MVTDREHYLRIWQMLEGAVFPLKHTVRMGTVIFGCLPGNVNKPVDYGHPEMVAAHAYALTTLMDLFFLEIPNYLPEKEQEFLKRFAMLHDISESVIGDVPDDGRAEHDLKFEREHEVFVEKTEALPATERERLREFFLEVSKVPDTTFLAQLFWTFDKTEAILYCLYLKKIGRPGNIYDKHHNMTRLARSQDWQSYQSTHCSDAAHIWAKPLYDRIKLLPQKIIDPFEALIKTSFEETYGQELDWWV